MTRIDRFLSTLAAAASLAACSHGGTGTQSQSVQDAPAQASPFIATATIKELMDSTVDPSADALWESVATVSSLAGEEEKKPRTPEEWLAVRRHAITLIEATNLLVMEGRHAAPAGTQPAEGELSPQQIDQRIASDRAAFVQFAHGLHATATKALEAIDRKDSEALLQAGGDIDSACEACHVTYWYPNQKLPTT